jgi:carboxymethylenebutenolidase
LVPKSRWSRRGFVATSLATGFALSVQPVSAQTITTDAIGLVVGEVKVPVKDGEIPAYRAMPDKPGPFATVLLVQEIFGVHEHIKDLCRRLAKVGYSRSHLNFTRARAIRRNTQIFQNWSPRWSPRYPMLR